MSTQIQRRRGTTTEHNTFTGVEGELTVDTTKDTVVVHDGATTGGHPLMREDGSNSALALGSATSPSLKWDANTGIYSPGADQLAISTNGTGRLFVDASGEVGIGTATPGASVHLGGNSATVYDGTATDGQLSGTKSLYISNGQGSNTTFSQIVLHPRTGFGYNRIVATGGSAPALAFVVNNNERLRITSTGQLSHIGGGSTGSPAVGFNGSAPANSLVVDSTGKVGLGTSSPGAILHTSQTSAGSSVIGAAIRNNAATASTGVSLDLSPIDAAPGVRSAQVEATNNGSNQINLNFKVSNGDVPATRMTLDYLGRLGIGSTSPGTKLDVYEGSASNVFIRCGNTNGYGDFGAVAGGTIYGPYAAPITSGSLLIGTSTNAPVTLWTNGSEKARLDTSGRLLVGTSSAIDGTLIQGVSTGAAGINLGRNAVLGSGSDVGNISFFSNPSSWQQTAKISAQADGAHALGDVPGRLVFSTTAAGASSPTERVRITSSGYLKASNYGAYINAAQSYHELRSNQPSTSTVLVENSSATGYGIEARLSSDGTSYAYFVGYSTSASANRIVIWSNGNVVNTNNSYGSISDAKLKENIVDANSQWDDLKALQVRNYNFKEGQTHTQIGLIAQEVELVSPGLVSESPDRDEDGNDLGTVTKSVNYSVLYMKAVKALQEAMERIETLEAKVAALEGA